MFQMKDKSIGEIGAFISLDPYLIVSNQENELSLQGLASAASF